MSRQANSRVRRSARAAKPIVVSSGIKGRGIVQVSEATARRAEAFERATAQAPFSDGYELIDQAASEGIIEKEMVEHFVALWEANPTETEKFLVAMGLNVEGTTATKKLGGLTFAQRTAKAKAAKTERVSAANEKRINQYLDTEQMLDQAIHAGVISAGLREHYSQCSAADPIGTREYLNNLGLNMMGVRQEARGTSPSASAVQEDYPTAHLTDAERNRISASRDRRVATRIVDGG